MLLNNRKQNSQNFVLIFQSTIQLKKVELEYEEFSIEIVGKISSGKIASIMQILEE